MGCKITKIILSSCKTGQRLKRRTFMRDANFVSNAQAHQGAMNKLSELQQAHAFRASDFIPKYARKCQALIDENLNILAWLDGVCFHAGRATMGRGGEYEAAKHQSFFRAVSGTASTGDGALFGSGGRLVEPEKRITHLEQELAGARRARILGQPLSALARLGLPCWEAEKGRQ